MSIFDEPKIDCHNHIFDPVRFPYRPDTHYRPAGQECGSAQLFMQVLDAYGVRHALVVGPNSGYDTDNRCLLDAIAQSDGRFKGIAVVDNACSFDALVALQAQGIVGVAFNPAFLGTAHYAGTAPLLAMLSQLGMLLQVQVEKDQLPELVPLLDGTRTHDEIAQDLAALSGAPLDEVRRGLPGSLNWLASLALLEA